MSAYSTTTTTTTTANAAERVADVLLATAIGVLLAAALVYGERIATLELGGLLPC